MSACSRAGGSRGAKASSRGLRLPRRSTATSAPGSGRGAERGESCVSPGSLRQSPAFHGLQKQL